MARLPPSHRGLPWDRAPVPGRSSAVSAHSPDYSPPISGNFAIPNAHGKEPKGLQKDQRFLFVWLQPAETPAGLGTQPWRSQGVPAQIPKFGWILPAPSRAVCPALATSKSSGKSTSRFPCFSQLRPGARDQGLATSKPSKPAGEVQGFEHPALYWERDLNPARAPVDV